ncbi:D-alanyl-D-alanine serine-type carboxypeptidase [Granulibacter bethesdensis CGDNIH4]|nr:D-alanyl-D-alanine serine-type carboxypeptidase [Granulibacter bethesdensis CGDNIH4]
MGGWTVGRIKADRAQASRAIAAEETPVMMVSPLRRSWRARLTPALFGKIVLRSTIIGGLHVSAGAAFLTTAATGFSTTAYAQIGSERYSSIVVDANTGAVLSASSPDELRHPASLTKMMTLYMLFEALRDRRVSLDDLVPVSDHAASMSPSKLGLVPGTRLTVEEAILGLVTKSANDAAAAVGEMLGGSEEQFAQMMTIRARALGMTRTVFRNASGLPDPDQISTAHDMAVLARHLILDFPSEYRYFSTPSFVFHRHVIPNHDRMLSIYPGADGLKTGYTNASGLNLVTSALRSDVRLIGVVFGASNKYERDSHMAALLNAGFRQEGVQSDGMAVAQARAPSFISSAHASAMPVSARTRVARHQARVPAAREVEVAEAPVMPRSRLHRSVSVVQVGAFSTRAAAQRAATGAAHQDGGKVQVTPVMVKGQKLWRAQVQKISSLVKPSKARHTQVAAR